MKKKTMFIIIGILIVATAIGAILVLYKGFYAGYYQDTALSGSLTIDQSPISIASNGRINIQKDKQYVSLVLDGPLKLDFLGQGIQLTNGEIIRPKIELIDSEGRKYPLIYAGGRRLDGELIANYEYAEGLPTGISYKELTISSETSFVVKRIMWSGYNIRDLP